ncbi:MAG: hypothetical protein IPL61_25580 [Myxococcales bacterium]|nr:hypothetical protein [Myxococcales bacterium]
MTYQLRRVRLVNLHNFVDETVEVRAGGHLFLLGDNGSGKTTVLDAVHDVLAGGELEWNAAARVGGRRDEGRSLQGVVLRFDAERGVRRAGGAIAYAALELCDPATGRVLTIGLGTEATTLEARTSRWGFVTARPLAEVALLDADDRPCDREGLRRQLGAAAVFAPLAAFRRELAGRLFGSAAAYQDAVRFWSMAKAYREIVATARDFGALFERLLPAPDGEVFDEVLRALAAIDDLEAALRDLGDQAAYVGGLVGLADEVGAAREAGARYRWLAGQRDLDAVAAAEAAARAEAATGAARAALLDGEVGVARSARDRAVEAVRRAEAADDAAAAVAIRSVEARRREVEADRVARGAEAAALEREARGCDVARAEVWATLEGQARALAARVAAAPPGEVPGDDAPLRALATALLELAPGARPATTGAAAWIGQAAEGARGRQVDAEVRAREAAAIHGAAARAVVTLRAGVDAEVRARAVEDALAALAAVGVRARPLYELLEPRPGAASRQVAGLERLLGVDVLEALVVDGDDDARARAAAALTAVGSSVRIVVATSTVALPPWCAALFAEELAGGPAGRALATALAQPADLGVVRAPEQQGTLRGLVAVVAADEPRRLGVEARRRARARALAEAEAALATAQRELDDASGRAAASRRQLGQLEEVAGAIAEVAAGALARAWSEHDRLVDRRGLLGRALREAIGRREVAAARVAVVDDELGALRARLDGADAAEIERRLARLRGQRDRADAQVIDAEQALAAARAQVIDAERRAASHQAAAHLGAAALDDALAELRVALAAIGNPVATADAATVASYVRVTQRGDSFRTTDAIRQRAADADRAAEAAAAELERDGARGVRCLAHASTFGFGYDRARNQVVDRRDQPAVGVLAELTRTIDEQRSVINERTRELMDRLVMGTLARQLQDQVHRLEETVRGINRVLAELRFGPSRYQFKVAPRPERRELVELVRRLSILDDASRREFRAWIDLHLDELRAGDPRADVDAAPRLLDYRRWFEYRLHVQATTEGGVELTQRLRQVGSGGEQGVPNYLLVLALAKLMFDAADARVRPLLFDEAFYGIDAGRRDQLLRLATDLGLQLLVASPDQDGVTPAVHAATTLFVVKDADGDVHLAPYYYWNAARAPQVALFAGGGDPPEDAVCALAAPAEVPLAPVDDLPPA